MKKYKVCALAVVMLFSLMFTACGSSLKETTGNITNPKGNGKVIVQGNPGYTDDDGSNFNIFGGGNSQPSSPGNHSNKIDKEVASKITPTAAKSVQFVKYSDPSGYFTLEAPSGWKVKTGLKGLDMMDLVSYAINVYDPKNPDLQVYFNLNCVAGVKSEEAHDWYNYYYGSQEMMSQLPVVEKNTTKSFYEAMGPLYGYSNFNVVENLGAAPLGGDLIMGECVSSYSGNDMEGVFTAWVTDGYTSYVNVNMFDPFSAQIDAGVRVAYDIVMETAPKGEFVEWQPILEHILSSIAFTKQFERDRAEAWKAITQISYIISSNADAMSDIIMSGYESRNTSYDISSQKYSDATLGYERVYDTETGEYYKAENGFSDWYTGSRYELVTSDSDYLVPVSGYINWK